MLRRALPIGLLLLVLASPVAAQDPQEQCQATATDFQTLCGVRLEADQSRLKPAPTGHETGPADARPAALPPLYLSMVGLQVLDVHSTWRVLNAGGSESNPLVRNIVGSPAGVVAVKAASSAAVIYAAEKMWKHNRTAAIVMMIGINSAYAAVVAHNYRAAR